MGAHRKPQKSLMELMEGQQGKAAPAQTIPSLVSSLPARSHPTVPRHLPQSSPPPMPINAAEQEKHKEQQSREVADASRSHRSQEEDIQRAAKQQKTRHPATRGQEKPDSPHPDSQAWLPAPMLGGEPLRNDASIRDFNGGIGCHVASAIEEALLLPKDMAEIKNVRKNQLILDNKRHLGMIIQNTFKLDEMLNACSTQLDGERKRRASALKEQAEQKGYELGIAETEKALRAEVPEVCRIFCARTWSEALNRAGVEASSELRRPENVYYPEAIRSSAPQSYQADTPSPAINPSIGEVPSRNSPNKPTTASKSETTSHDFQQELDSTVQSTGGIAN
ncbi:uncharacterized protein LOC115957027 [Quercus lobata]|uniref:uncharacterized protein LOC115957027 n=1 Tax=Quercus lobata TaxID=97700 RepID=UPI0012488D43|nr:uncharacterized protein LOC115957027 [Quercus lobata]